MGTVIPPTRESLASFVWKKPIVAKDNASLLEASMILPETCPDFGIWAMAVVKDKMKIKIRVLSIVTLCSDITNKFPKRFCRNLVLRLKF